MDSETLYGIFGFVGFLRFSSRVRKCKYKNKSEQSGGEFHWGAPISNSVRLYGLCQYHVNPVASCSQVSVLNMVSSRVFSRKSA